MTSVYDITAAAENLWPLSGADVWDRPGLIAGQTFANCERVLFSVDVTSDVLDEAVAGDFGMILSHHPFLLGSQHELAANSAKGSVLLKSIRNNIALYSAHTNADIVADGVSDVLAKALGLPEAKPLLTIEDTDVGHGRIAKLAETTTLVEFARSVARSLPATAPGVRVAGNPGMAIQTVALCAGSGGSFLDLAIDQGADVYVTSDLRHHSASDAIERARAIGLDFALIDISHWAAESLWLEVAAKQLAQALPDVKFVVSDLRTDPWDFAVTQ
ncbi:MAG: Nif3-like dinuclear metal center hexameric protein [Rhodoluna sp.]|nr:Nif3-like dinuclear metal center hexameric protein [Rhodoluna sp.]